jgi:hypothetical protein
MKETLLRLTNPMLLVIGIISLIAFIAEPKAIYTLIGSVCGALLVVQNIDWRKKDG